MTDLRTLQTPALVLDLDRLEANCRRMIERCRSLGVRLRPHMKTLKSAAALPYVVDPEHGGIAVATLNEAEYFARAGVSDIQYAVCLSPDKLPRAEEVLRKAPLFSFFLDGIETADAVAAYAAERGVPLRAWIEIDSGEHRTGIDPEAEELLAIAGRLSASPVVLCGVATHGGHSYRCESDDEVAEVAEQERLAVMLAACRLRDARFEVPGVSAGSTPTALRSRSADGLTEYRAGVYMAGDTFQVSAGSLPLESVAATVLATVISHNRAHNQIVVDAGGLALSKDRSCGRGNDYGYGLVLDASGEATLGRLVVAGVHQEHGEIRGPDPLPFDRLPVGSRVRIVPNHVCMTAAMYDEIAVTRQGEVEPRPWTRTNGWAPARV